MATTFVEYPGNGGATKQFTFPSYQSSDVKVRVDGVLKTVSTHYNITNYTTTGGGDVVFTSGNIPSSGTIRIYRDTNVDVAKATFTAGSSVKAADLNNNNTQLLYRSQEEQIPNLIHSYDIDDAAIETSNIKDSSVTTAKIAADAVTNAKIADDSIDSEHYVDGSIDTQHIADAQITHVKLANDSVDGDNIQDDVINSEHYVAGSIDTEHIANVNVTTAKLANDAVTSAKLADNAVLTANITDANVTTAKIAADAVDGTKIADDSINSEHYVDGSIDTAHIADAQITTAKIADGAITDAKIQGGSLDNRYYTETELDAGQLDNRYYTEAESDARYFNISTGDTIKDGDTFPDNDTTIATTAAINDRIIDLVDDVGGFVPIANETSFPTANPDVNGGAGTIVSVKAASTNLAPSGTTVTIANGRGSGLAVIITGVSATIPSGFGFLVETTTTDHTYAFHRLVPKATEVTTVAGIASNITTVANNTSNINAVAADASDIGIVAADGTDIGLVAGSISNVNTTAGSIANVNTTAGSIANVNTVGGAISNVNSVAGSIANVNTTASNIADVNNFAATYQIASSAPSTDGAGNALAAGDLYFDTSSNELRVHNGSTFQGGVTATGNLAGLGANTFTGHQSHGDNVKNIFGTGNDLEIYHNGNDSVIDEVGTGDLKIRNGGANKLIVSATGIGVTGNITVSGNVDGRDVAADGVKLDSISTSAIANVVQDTSPQLGGNLDVQTSFINTSATNGHIYLQPNGTGVVEIRGAGGNDGTLQLNCSAQSHGIKLKSPPHSAGQNYTLTFPSSLTNNGVLTTNSSGTLSAGLLGTANIADDAVTAAKIADGTITSSQIAANTIGTGRIADDAVTAAKLANTSVTAGSYGSATAIPAITVDAQGRITAASTNTVNTTTNLATTTATDSITVTSSTGNNATISEATGSAAGVMSVAHHDKLDGIEASATADQTNSEIAAALSDQRPSMKGADLTDDGTGSPVLHVKADDANPWGVIIGNATYSGNQRGIKLLQEDNGNTKVRISGQGEYRLLNFEQDDGSSSRALMTLSEDGSVSLRHQGTIKLNTTSTGATVSGNLAVTGTVDGVDVAALSSTVSGITSNATHSGEVTGATALTIADNVVDEANLKISNSPVNGYMLTAQSGNTGGLTWAPAAAGATGASNDEIFWENGTNVTADYTITNGKNAGSFGPITIDSGVTVTVGAGETWTVV